MSTLPGSMTTSSLRKALRLASLAICILSGRAAFAQQVPPAMYSWDVGTPSPTMMNNDTGYCWLAGLYANFNNTNDYDYVNLTFDSTGNWIFTGLSPDGPAGAIALCQPWSSLTYSPGQPIHDQEFFGLDTGGFINAPVESMCGIEGIGGVLYGGSWMGSVSTGSEDNDPGLPNGTVNIYGGRTSGIIWGQCANFGSSQTQLHPTLITVTTGQSLNLGSSLTQMCVLDSVNKETASDEDPNNALSIWLWVDQDNNYELSADNVGIFGSVTAACIPIQQP